MTLQYFDRSLRNDVKGTATCEAISTSSWAMSVLPQVTCTGEYTTVKLPTDSREVTVVGKPESIGLYTFYKQSMLTTACTAAFSMIVTSSRS